MLPLAEDATEQDVGWRRAFAPETHGVMQHEVGVTVESTEFLGFDHVLIAIPADGEVIARGFYCGVLGLEEEPKPAPLLGRGGLWLQSGPLRLHLGVDPEFRPAGKAHPALAVRGLDGLLSRCEASGCVPEFDEPLDGLSRAFVRDPFGNRLELVERLD